MKQGMNFRTIEYLKVGNEKQRQAYEILTSHQILSDLEIYDPILVGTIPIHIDIETSDLDILCCWKEKQEFIDRLIYLFGNQSNFKLWENTERQAVVASFVLSGFEIEIFGQNIPTNQQVAYRHMLVEFEILNWRGEKFRQEIVELKRQGYKTEPAFGIALGLKGNPYEELLTYEIKLE